MTEIVIAIAEREVIVALRPKPSPTVRQLLESLPFASKANRWGDEVYFEAPFHSDLERDAQQDMDVGDVAYWPDGDALAIFFGRTPASDSEKPRAYSRCNMLGKVVGDSRQLEAVESGASVHVVLR